MKTLSDHIRSPLVNGVYRFGKVPYTHKLPLSHRNRIIHLVFNNIYIRLSVYSTRVDWRRSFIQYERIFGLLIPVMI